MLATSILGPLLTEHFAPRMLTDATAAETRSQLRTRAKAGLL
jgi:hypothetical protein